MFISKQATSAALLAALFSTAHGTCDCIDGTFCNYDFGDSGECEKCFGFVGDDCYSAGLPDKGAADCEQRCFESSTLDWQTQAPNGEESDDFGQQLLDALFGSGSVDFESGDFEEWGSFDDGPCDCIGGTFCNYDSGDGGRCEECSEFMVSDDCYKDFLPDKGAAECEQRCFESSSSSKSIAFLMTAAAVLSWSIIL